MQIAQLRKNKELTLPAEKFIQRFLNHVLPKGFTRIRHYGFLACRTKKDKLQVIRKTLNASDPGEKIKYQVYRERSNDDYFGY
ncbi:MAG: transposase [Salinivirgaceae bacterium]|nr:transposase [Salinivirgaceae bacterium]